uniref:CMP/dCMP-type deaminase domain-containing protein n=1 Tax=Rhabditophanes sp. KR3021 TaxID=114890 RepID=A0AC35UCH3_9BILA
MVDGKNDFMKIAVEEAKKGMCCGDGGPFGAVVVRDGKIVASGHNMVLVNKDPTCHAEVTAIRNACKVEGNFDLSGCDLYTSCYPCPMCMGACLWARIGHVYYAANSQEAEDAGFSDKDFHLFLQQKPNNAITKLVEYKVTDYLQPFIMWKENEQKVPY